MNKLRSIGNGFLGYFKTKVPAEVVQPLDDTTPAAFPKCFARMVSRVYAVQRAPDAAPHEHAEEKAGGGT